jgi:hypothetical protein
MVTLASKFLYAKSVFVSALVIGILLPCASIAQTTPSAKPGDNRPSPNPNTLTSGVFSVSGAERLMSEAMGAISKQNYDLAVTKLQDARQICNQLSNFYQDLTGSFTGLDNRIADSHRQKALQSAQLRDQATYQLALVYRAKNQPELSVPLLVQLIRSQQPTRDLGKQAYQQLYELGFVDDVFPRPTAAVSTPPK